MFPTTTGSMLLQFPTSPSPFSSASRNRSTLPIWNYLPSSSLVFATTLIIEEPTTPFTFDRLVEVFFAEHGKMVPSLYIKQWAWFALVSLSYVFSRGEMAHVCLNCVFAATS